MTYTQLIREIAKEQGHWHRPKFYIDAVERETGHRVHHGTVIAALGTHQTRAATAPIHLKTTARHLLNLCLGDRFLARWMVNSVAQTVGGDPPTQADRPSG